MEDPNINGEVPLVPTLPAHEESEKRPLTGEEIQAIKRRKNYIEYDVRDNNGNILSTMKVNVKILDYKYVWGNNRFLVSPVSGEGSVWKDWKQLKATDDIKLGQ